MTREYLDFEEPIAQLERKILELESAEDLSSDDISYQIDALNKSIIETTQKIYKKLSPWQCVQVARHPSRPHFFSYLDKIFNEFDELHGDRNFGDDRALIGGLAKIDNHPVIVIGHEKGNTTEEKLEHNFGMPQPEGYRKAARLMKLAERFEIPVITFIDTPGAYPGIDSEERGQSEAIASNLEIMSSLKTPIIVNVIGEGGSGGALAIGVGDVISMMEYSTYSVASPEACASIVWRDPSKAPQAAEAMKLDSENLLNLKLIDEIIKEPMGGAHRDPDLAASSLKRTILKNLDELSNFSIDELIDRRYQRLMTYGK
ncbi:MAG: acetyl-coenzyme A carboxylase carboxyl transferase subunit alpha [Gammaproteobacteria bacterium]|nr:MAG: acetyl-coenzyme A carboxylase carboxyl transferase subunit alpha [Gammaproteobacteria bacterium]|tara:strand:- start:559 stop:1506 length:948 start_codon:yes stop_codon:yes gene_type:complete